MMPEDEPTTIRNTTEEDKTSTSNGDVSHEIHADAHSVQQTISPTSYYQVPASTELKNSPGLLVLQWLVYAFWGWTVVALSVLTSLSIGYFIDSQGNSYYDSTFIAYPLAAVIVLFVISIICDIFYAKQEPVVKHGAAMVIMIIHAVIFSLVGIGALITAVFAGVRMLIGESNTDGSGSLTMLVSALIIAAVYAVTLVRTLRPKWLRHASRIYWIIMTLLVLSISTLAVVGPTAYARFVKNDRAIEAGLPQVSDAINRYAQDKGNLPASLGVIADELNGDAEKIVSEGLVKYNAGQVLSSPTTDLKITQLQLGESKPTVYEYELCVDYKAKSRSYDSYSYGNNQRDVTPDTYSHKAGDVCYDLQTEYTD